MPETIPLQATTVYGPIHSRRLGYSLGINPLPATHKICSSDCVYCQYGWTPTTPSPEPIKRAPALLAEIAEAFQRHRAVATPVDCLTLAGNGEPTVHPDFRALVTGLVALRDEYFPKAQIGVLSDATQLHRATVREALQRLDARYMKFDAANEALWRQINKPRGDLTFAQFLEGLRSVPDIILQSLFMQGSFDNTDDAHVEQWVAAVGDIRPLSVQVYSVDRGTAAPGITEVPEATLQDIADRLTRATGIPAEVFD